MRRRSATASQGLYPAFVSTSASVLVLVAAGLIFSNSHAVPSGQVLAPPAEVTAFAPAVSILGAEIGRGDLRKLRAVALNAPWERALVLQDRGDVFLPAANMAEAFAICEQLADSPVSCAPIVASSDRLQTANGNAVTRDDLRRSGAAPYAPVTQRWHKVV